MIIMNKFLLLVAVVVLCIIGGEAQTRKCSTLKKTGILKYTCSNTFYQNSRCFYRCNVGYVLTSKQSQMRICRCTGNRCSWTGRDAFCMVKPPVRRTPTVKPTTKAPVVRSSTPRCSAVPVVPRTRSTCTKSTHSGSTCYYTCTQGSLVNPQARSRQCRCRGSRCFWTGSAPICTVRRTATTPRPTTARPTTKPATPRCTSLPSVERTRTTCTKSTYSGSTCFYTCTQGSLVNPQARSRQCRCQGSRCFWTGSTPFCTVSRPATTKAPQTTTPAPQRCTTLAPVPLTTVTCTKGSLKGTRCTYTCVGGRMVNSAGRRVCRCRGTRCFWTGTVPICARTTITTTTTTTTTTPIPTTTIPPTTTTAYKMPERSVVNNCPVPDFGRHSFQVVDTWPTGAILRIIINKDHLLVDHGWSVLLTFTKDLPDNLSVISWTSRIVSYEGKYLSLTNQRHNDNLTGVDVFSFTIVVIGASLENMGGYTALVAFYPEPVANASCFVMANNGNPGKLLQAEVPTATPTTIQTRQPRARPMPPVRPPVANIPTVTTTRPTTTTQPHNNGNNNNNWNGNNNNNNWNNNNNNNQNQNNNQNTNSQNQNNNHDNNNNNQDNNNNHNNNDNNDDNNNNQEMQMDSAAVQKMKGSCNVLQNSLRIKNPGYESGSNKGKFRFNADVVISGENNMIDDWTLKVVFSKPIQSLQVWEADMSEKSHDGYVYLFRPKSWNSKLRKDFSFLIIPEMSTQDVPKTVMFLCPSGVKPSMDWRGIFRAPQQQNQGNSLTQAEQEKQRLRQEAIAREQRLQEEERRRQQQLEEEQRQRQENRPNNNNNNGNNNNQHNNNNNNNNQHNNNNNNQHNNNNNQQNNNQHNNNNNQNNNNQNNNQNNNHNNQNNNNNNRDLNHHAATHVDPNFHNNDNNNNPTTYQRPSSNSQGRCGGPKGILPKNPKQTRVIYRKSPVNERKPYDYSQVIAMSILFYEAQRSGKLPRSNRIPWRGDSGLRDGCDVSKDLTGGWYDAGDHVKFGFPMAWSVTTLAWGVIEFESAYQDIGEHSNVLSSLRWVTDYFLKAHTAKYELYGQVGSGQADHSYWGRGEQMNMARPSYKIDKNNPGTELAAETAAALAACSVVFRESDPIYANKLVKHAKELYEFADKYRRSYHMSMSAVNAYYRSYNGFNDELVWGALWLYRATGISSYLTDAKNKYQQFGGGNTPKMFSWDDKRAGSQVLLANFTGESKYISHIQNYQNFLNGGGAHKTPKGLVWLDQWGSNRYAANAAFIALAAAKVPSMPNKNNLITFARSQIHYMLGSSGRSYVVGYGKNPPKRPHHRGSSCAAPPADCSWGNAFHNSSPNPFTLYGALIAGPDKNDKYVDDRQDYVANEVATDYNAGFQSALAGLKYFQIQARRTRG